ncbi:hypothetical protein FOZ62_009718 [Perkinsus olseni]|uniref:Uncharacterized protein n=1 Tax=Perkinsus olseni TaxID=32597 RepID=A0A7J6QCD8_PEROL|nr:hypothetical protein FOZ62_009718 [Perkinsus olseni]
MSTTLEQVMANYSSMNDEELGTIDKFGALTKLYEDSADYQNYKGLRERILAAYTNNKVRELQPLQLVNSEELNALRQKLWTKYADLGTISTTTDLSIPIVHYNYDAEVLDVEVTTKDYGFRTIAPDFLKPGLLMIKYTPEITTNMFTSYELALANVALRTTAVLEPTTWLRLEASLRLFLQRGTTKFLGTSKTITKDLVSGFGDYFKIDTIGKLARWNLIEVLLDTRKYWSPSTSTVLVSIPPLQLDAELTTVTDYYIPIALHHSYQRLHTLYKTMFVSTMRREATRVDDTTTLRQLEALPEALAKVYYKNEHYLQLLTVDDAEEKATIEALRLAELQVYYDGTTTGDVRDATTTSD